MARLDDSGNLDYTDPQFDPTQVVQPKKQVITDPSAQNNPAPDPTQWAPGSSAPPASSTPPGMHWDPTMANYVADAPAAPTAPTNPTKPGGGNINDPAYLDSLLKYYGSQPGVNPSVTNDPQYWKDAVASGRFNGDEGYLTQRFFQPEGAPEGASKGGPAPAPTGGGGATDSSPLSSFLSQWLQQQQGNNSTTQAQRQSLLDRLGGMADKFSAPVTADDPNIKAQTDAYHGTMGRAVNMFQKKAAERAYAEGVPTGAFDSQIGNAEQTAGQQEGTLQSQLMSDELNSRRANLMQTLQQSGSLLSAQDQNDLQSKIASVTAALESRGQDITKSLGEGQLALGGQSLDLQKVLGMSALDLQRLGLGNQTKSIDNQNNQFYDKLGSDNANQGSSLDAVLTQLILSGGLK